MAWYFYPAVVAAGLAAGFINTLAGSGSLITLPLLIFLGLPAGAANGTNRVAILLQSAVAAEGFRRQGVLHLRRGLLLAVPALAGAVLGARFAVDLNEETLRRAIGLLMVVMLCVLLLRPKSWLKGRGATGPGLRLWAQVPLLFGIGLYGGFIQLGVGIFLLAGLVLGAGFNLVRANAVKVLIILVYTPLALAVFILHGQVRWGVGLTLAVGNMLGAWIGVKTAAKRGEGFVRWVLVAVVAVAATVLLRPLDLIDRFF